MVSLKNRPPLDGSLLGFNGGTKGPEVDGNPAQDRRQLPDENINLAKSHARACLSEHRALHFKSN